MNPIQQLVERRLWPVAALLIAALVAVPFLLKKSPEPAPLASVPVATPVAASGDPEQSVVESADAGKADKVRAVLGSRKDPFRPGDVERVPTPSPTPKAATVGGTEKTAGTGGASSDKSSTAGGDTSTPADTVETPTATPAPTYDVHSLLVRFGDVNGDLTPRNPKRLTALGGGETPVMLYLGLLDDEKTAVFLVDAGVDVTGDGKCTPSGKDCQTLTLKPGQTEFFTRGDKTWELDLLKVITDQTTNASVAAASRAAVSRDATKKVSHHADRVSGYKYDKVTGFLSRSAPTAKVSSAHHPTIAKTVALTTTG